MEVHNKCNVHCTSPTHDPKYWHMTSTYTIAKKNKKTSGGLPSCSGYVLNFNTMQLFATGMYCKIACNVILMLAGIWYGA